jgi:broad specificity phosphatase PhoE
MGDVINPLQKRDLWFVCHDALQDERLISGALDLAVRPSPRSRYDRLRKALPEGEVLRFMTPTRRCHQTAARLAAEFEWEETDQLRARAMGAWEGSTWTQIREDDPVRAEAFWTAYGHGRAPGGGESLGDVRERLGGFLTGLTNRTDWTTAIVITHPEVVRVAVCDTIEADLNNALRLTVDPLSVTRLSHTWVGWQVEATNLVP